MQLTELLTAAFKILRAWSADGKYKYRSSPKYSTVVGHKTAAKITRASGKHGCTAAAAAAAPELVIILL
jgi:hypothetical protein